MPWGLTEQQLFIFPSSSWPENLFCGRVQVAVLRSTFISSSFWMAGLVLASEERFSSPEIPPFSFYLLLLFFVEKLPDYCILKHSKYSVYFFCVIVSPLILLSFGILSLHRDSQTDGLRLFLHGAHINHWVNLRGFTELILAEAFVKAPVSIGCVYIH